MRDAQKLAGEWLSRATIGAALIAVADSAMAQEKTDAAPSPSQSTSVADSTVDATTEGILPIPDYGGDLWTRAYLLGDWGGTRANLANNGIQIGLEWNQYGQGVVDGGRDETTRYGGKGDYLILFDLQRMGVMPGALIKFRGESRYGYSVNAQSGQILPVNNDAFFPLTDQLDDDLPFAVTNLVYTQFLSAKFGVFLGKIDTIDGDPNEFASGRGTSQFMNANFTYNATLALRMPYSTLAAGVVVMPSANVTITSSVMNTLDSSTTSGFDDFGEGGTWTTEADLQHSAGGLPGGQNVGFLYSFDQDFTQLGGQLIFDAGEGVSAPEEDDTWAVYWSGWQYVYAENPSEGPVDLANGEADHQGVGFFTRLGFADEDTNPVEWSVSGGLGGRGIFSSRDDDTFGLGYYYSSIQDLRVSGVAGIEDAVQGFEAFYNIAITPAAHLTLDAQFVDPVSSDIDDAVVLGVRLGMGF